MQFQLTRLNRSTVNAETGHHAPLSGWWRPESDPLQVRFLQQGEIMPALAGSQTVWMLLNDAAPFLEGTLSQRS